MHAQHPILAIWDDHESANNSWIGGAKNHQADEGPWTVRKTASLRAYYEWMPVRDPVPGSQQKDYWRHLSFGDLASVITLETRLSGRSRQVDYEHYRDNLEARANREAFTNDVLGDPNRRLLSPEMETFLGSSLKNSIRAGQRWQIIGSPSVMANWMTPPLDESFYAAVNDKLGKSGQSKLDRLSRVSGLGLPDSLDEWNGYPNARERFYDTCSKAGARGLLVLSGDSHSAWANLLRNAEGRRIGIELGAPGITSPSTYYLLGDDAVHELDRLIATHNVDVGWVESRYRGFIRLELTPARIHADFIAISNVESRAYTAKTIKSLNIVRAHDSLRFAK